MLSFFFGTASQDERGGKKQRKKRPKKKKTADVTAVVRASNISSNDSSDDDSDDDDEDTAAVHVVSIRPASKLTSADSDLNTNLGTASVAVYRVLTLSSLMFFCSLVVAPGQSQAIPSQSPWTRSCGG